MTRKPFDPWDWLGVDCGGFHFAVDQDILEVLETLRDDGNVANAIGSRGAARSYKQLICTLLCNTDAFEFDEDPTQLKFVGDERFEKLDDLIDAWDIWFAGHY